MKPYVVDGLQRPRTRSECEPGGASYVRPCPWVSCRHHLLLDVSKTKPKDERIDPRASTIRLNRPPRGRFELGRRAGLPASAPSAIVRRWIDDAAEALFSAEASCALDVTDSLPDGIVPSAIARVLGLTEPTIDQELRKPQVRGAFARLEEFIEPSEPRGTYPNGTNGRSRA